MRRECTWAGSGVPYAARHQLGHAHLQLAGGEHLVYDHLVDVALVRSLQRTHVGDYGVGLRHLLVGIVAVSRRGVEVELRGMFGILASNVTSRSPQPR